MKLSKKILSLLLCAVMVLGSVVVGGEGFAEVLETVSFKASAYSTGDYIYYGTYPQSEVTDSSLISALNGANGSWKSYGYYSGTGDFADGRMKPSDYMRYKDVSYNGSKYRAVTFDSYRPFFTEFTHADGTYQDDNGYTTGNVYWFKYEPIKWRVLDPSTGLIMCDTAIDSQAYNNYFWYGVGSLSSSSEYYGDEAHTYYASNYAKSSIRAWLNKDFYNTAFSDEQKSNIVATTLDNSSTDSSAYDAPSTTDKIFLLSYNDSINSSYGFNSSRSAYDTARQLKITDYAKCQGCYQYQYQWDSYRGNCCWWLRSPCNSYYPCEASVDGSSGYSDHNVNYTSEGVVPALRLSNLKSDYAGSEIGSAGSTDNSAGKNGETETKSQTTAKAETNPTTRKISKNAELGVYSSVGLQSVSPDTSLTIEAFLIVDGKAEKTDSLSFSITDSSVAEISSVEKEGVGYRAVLHTKGKGNTILVVYDSSANITKQFPIYVTDQAATYYADDIMKPGDIYVSGMYIEASKVQNKKDGSSTVSFDVYNLNNSIGSVDVFDSDGQLKESFMIDKFDADYPTDIFSHLKETALICYDLVTLDFFNSNHSSSQSKRTSVKVEIPKDGYIVITNNVNLSTPCLWYNLINLAVETAFKVCKIITDDYTTLDEVKKEMMKSVPWSDIMSENIKELLEKTLKEIVSKSGENLVNSFSSDYDEVMAALDDVFKSFGTTFIDSLIEAIKKVHPKLLTDGTLKALTEKTLKNFGMDIVDTLFYKPVEISGMINFYSTLKNNMNSRGLYYYNPQSGKQRISNGIKLESDSFDENSILQTVLITQGELSDYIDGVTEDNQETKIFDFRMVKNGDYVQPSSTVTAYIPIPEGWDSSSLCAYHITDSGTKEKLKVTVKNGYISFKTDSFSCFVISTDEIDFSGFKLTDTNTEDSGKLITAAIIIAVLLAIIILLIIILINQKMKNKGKSGQTKDIKSDAEN